VPTGLRLRLSILLTAFTFVPASAALAQQPFRVDDAEVAPHKQWQLETNLEWDKLRASAAPYRWQAVADAEVDFGVAPRLQVSAVVPFMALARSDRFGRHTDIGLSDVSFGAKYRLTKNPTAATSYAVSLDVELPTGSHRRGLGSSLTDVSTNVVWQHHLNSRWTLRGNAGVVFAGNTQTGLLGLRERGTMVTSGASVTTTPSPRLLLGAEVSGIWSGKESIGDSYVQWQLGGNVLLRQGLTLDLGLLGGHSDASPVVGVQIGCTLAL